MQKQNTHGYGGYKKTIDEGLLIFFFFNNN